MCQYYPRPQYAVGYIQSGRRLGFSGILKSERERQVVLLAIAANVPAWGAFLTPIVTGAEWLAALVGLGAGVSVFAMQGMEWLSNRSQWGHLINGLLGGTAGVGFAAGAVAMGTALGGAIVVPGVV
jgi:ABC-type multidrug transport system permease subunit